MKSPRFELSLFACMSFAVAATFHATGRPGWVVGIITAFAVITAAGAVLARPSGRHG